jgi:hypothetical protein
MTGPASRTLTPAQWAATEATIRSAGATDAVVFAVAVGCPRHGNAWMDTTMDGAEAFCHACDAVAAGHGYPLTLTDPPADLPAPPAPTCPGCGERAVRRSPVSLVPWGAHGLVVSVWCHVDGEPLCPVLGLLGYLPIEPVTS